MKLIFLGPPGAGKGTQAVRIAQALGVPHISTGDMFRSAMREGTPTGLRAKAYMDKGELVPDEVTIDIVRERLSAGDCQKGFLLDGFPRTVAQAEALSAISEIDRVVNIDVSDDELVTRLSGRRVCAACGGTHHVATLGGKDECPACGEKVIQRQDDMPETVLNRLKVYHAQTSPLIGYYKERGLLSDVNGAQGMEEVKRDILAVLEGQ